MSANKKRDPAIDADATLRDFIFRLRRMGYPGNLRIEVPIYTPEDVRWLATLLGNAQAELLNIVRDMPPCGGRVHEPLRVVLAARGVMADLDQGIKRHTSHDAARRLLRDERAREAAHG